MTLYLVDGHALAFRSYYAFIRQPLVNSKGEETSAVFGFLNTMLNLISGKHPDYLAVVFDTPAPTFRHEKFDAYKANRAEMPESLAGQLPVIYELLRTMHVAQYSLDGYEADDIIATIARKCEPEVAVRVVSGDKDLLQLVSDRIHVIRPGKANVLEKEIDSGSMKETVGLEAAQIVDYLALVGDTSDNVPGVRGIGQKTATKLLAQYGSLDGLYENLDGIKSGSLRRKLEEGREDAFLSRDLVVLDCDAPLSFSLQEMAHGEFRSEQLKSLLEDLEFDRLKRNIFGEEGPPDEDVPPPEEPPEEQEPSAYAAGEGSVAGRPSYNLVETETDLATLARKLEGAASIAVDVETSSVDPMRAVLAGISVATRPGEAFYVPVTSPLDDEGPGLMPAGKAAGLEPDRARELLGPVLASQKPGKIGQNIKYDSIVLERAGMPLGGVVFDTMIASYCLDPGRRSHGLDALAVEFFGHEMIPFASLFETRSRVKDIRTVPLERVVEYACEDSDYTLRLHHAFKPMLAASRVESLFYDVEMPLQDVLRRMETTGVKIDVGFLDGLSRRYAEEIGGIEEKIYTAVGEPFNINSTQQLREVLFSKLGLKPSRRTKTGYSTDVEVLKGLADQHEVPRLLLEYRQLVKLKSTYVDALPKLVHPDTGRVHTSYNQAVTSTGRLSSSDPNLQNIPIRTAEGREIRRAFVASGPDRVLLDADYSQIELRILAHLSRDEELMAAFREGADVHRRTAARILGTAEENVSDETRNRAKAVNFGIVYGMGARGLANSLDIPVAEAKTFIDEYFASYPGVKRFIDDTIENARRDKRVETMLGRIRQLPDIGSSNGGLRSFSERIAVNTPVQGTAADIIKLAMLDVDRKISERAMRSRMILQVHDELLFDVPAEELEEMKDIVRTCMENAVPLDVPLKVDMGTGATWLEAH